MEKLEVRWTQIALEDLKSTHEYILKENRSAAFQVINKITLSIEQICGFPHIGKVGRATGTQELVVPNVPFVIVYRVRSNVVEVLAILHQTRRWS